MLVNLAAFVVVVAGVMAAKSLLIPFLLAIFLAIICSPPLFWLRKYHVPTAISILLLVIIVLVAQIGITTLIGSSLAEFTTALPQYQSKLKILLGQLIVWLEGFGIDITDDVLMEQFDPGKLMGIVGNMLNNLLAMLKNTFMILLAFIFILLEAAGIPTKFKAIVGGSQESMDRLSEIIQGVNRYLALKTITSLVTGVLAGISLQVIGVDYVIMWAVLTFFLNFVPTVGSIIAAVPPVLLALVQLGVGPALACAVIYLAINVIIGNFLEPRIMGSGVGLSAMVIFISMAFWGWVLGPVGMLLSVPLTMTLKIAMATNEKTRPIALLLGSNSEAAAALQALPDEKDA